MSGRFSPSSCTASFPAQVMSMQRCGNPPSGGSPSTVSVLTRRIPMLGCTRHSFAGTAGRSITRSFSTKMAGSLVYFRDPSMKPRSRRTEDGEQAGYLMPEPEGDADYAFTGALEDYPEDWLETGPKGGIRLRSNRRRFASSGNHCGSWRSSRDHRSPSVVLAGQVPLLPCVQGSAANPGARDQQARELVGRGAKLGDDPAGVERPALDEWRSQFGCS